MPVEGEVHLGARPLEPEALDVLDQVVGQLARVDELEEGPPRVEGADHGVGVVLRPVRERDARRPAVLRDDGLDRRLQDDLGAIRLGGPGQHLGEPAVALLVEGPRPEHAVVLPDRVVQQHEPRALRARPDLRADDARRGEVALQQLGIEVVVEEVGGAAGQEPDRVVQHALVELAEARPDPGEGEELLGVVAEDVGRDHVEQRLDGLADHVDVVAVLVVRVGVVLGVPRDLLEVLVVVLREQQVLAVLPGRQQRRHQQRHEAVLGELQVVDDVRPQQGQRIREGREPEARAQLLGDGRAADEVPAFDDQGLEAGLREVRAVDQAVVAATDDDRVVGAVGARARLRRPRRRLRAVRGRRRRRALRRGLAGRDRRRHVRPSFAQGCRAAAAPRGRRPARNGGRP